MTALSTTTMLLPVLRPDVEFHRGPDEADGAPTYTLHDPLRGTFEKLTWVQAEILRRLRVSLTVDRLLEQLAANTTIRVSDGDVLRLCQDASRKGLTMEARVCDAYTWEVGQRALWRGGLSALFRGLVFVRVPLIRPDRFLERTVGVVRGLAAAPMRWAYASVALLGVLLLIQRFDSYLATFPYFFSPRGVLCFGLTIAALKVVHEFSHAYVAKAMGNRVPTMGVVLILLFPVAYADITDSWRMRDRRRRLLITLAGVLAELVIAGFALVAWALSPPGILRSVCFVISSSTLISTLLVNLNPVMRFDGYYVLSDLLGIDNLQARSFLVGRWVLRRYVLGMPLASPDVGSPPRRLALLTVYAACAWIYRLCLYSGIAWALYHRFTKALGGLLLVVALYTFLIKPVGTEMLNIFRMRRLVRWNVPRAVGASLLAMALLWAAWPLPHWRAVPATTTARNSQVIYAPGEGVLCDLAIGLNSHVQKGQPLFALASSELDGEAELARLDVERVETELVVVRNDERQRGLLREKLDELARANARLDAVRTAIARNRVVAEIDGVVVEWDDSVRNGTPIGARHVLGRIVEQREPRVVCYVPHDLAADVNVGAAAVFCSDAQPERLAGDVQFVESVRTSVLEQSGLASTAGGDIAVVPDPHGRLQVVDSVYRAEIGLDDPPATLRVGQTGTVWLRTKPRSRLAELARYGYRVLVRESSF